MGLFHRREALPVEVGAQLPKGERVLTWADASAGKVVFATSRGLWWPADDGHRLIGWEHVDKAVWLDGRLTVTEAEVVDDLLLVDRPPIAVELSTPRDLPATVRKRVEANIVRTEVRPLGGGAARFVARRIPGRDGVVWWVRLEGAVSDSDEVRSLVTAEVALLRADWAAAQG